MILVLNGMVLVAVGIQVELSEEAVGSLGLELRRDT